VLDALAARVVVGELSEQPSCVALANTRGTQGAVESAPGGLGTIVSGG
jgi:hypothetical protein